MSKRKTRQFNNFLIKACFILCLYYYGDGIESSQLPCLKKLVLQKEQSNGLLSYEYIIRTS